MGAIQEVEPLRPEVGVMLWERLLRSSRSSYKRPPGPPYSSQTCPVTLGDQQ